MKNEGLVERLSLLQEAHAETSQKCQRSTNTAARLQEEVLAHANEHDELIASQSASLQRQIATRDAESHELQIKVKCRDEELSEHRAERGELMQSAAEANKRAAVMDEKLKRADDMLALALAEGKQRLLNSEQRNADLEEQVLLLQEDVKQACANTPSHHHQPDFEALEKNFREVDNRLCMQVSRLQAQLAREKDERSEGERRLQEYKAKQQELVEQLARIQDDHDKVASQLAQLHATTAKDKANAVSRIVDLDLQLSQHTARKTLLEARVGSLEALFRQRDNEFQELQDARQAVDKLEEELRTRRTCADEDGRAAVKLERLQAHLRRQLDQLREIDEALERVMQEF